MSSRVKMRVSVPHISDDLILRLRNHVLLNKTARALMIFVALAMLPYGIPSLNRYQVLVPSTLINRLHARANEASGDAEQSVSLGMDDNSNLKSSVAVQQITPGKIEDPSGHALDSFFAALLKTETEGEQTRICHYGDSPITNDGITSTVRRRLQLKFGDAGHGFILIDKPWGWYGHIGVTQEASRGWSSDPMFISRGEHYYGLGGVSFTTEAAGVTSTLGTAGDGDVGRSVSAFDIYYLARPGGGDFEVEVDGQSFGRVATASDELRSGFHRVTVDEGAHRLTIKTVGNGQVQIFGVALCRKGSGVQYDSLGVNGAYIGLLAHYLDADHWAEQLRHRNPALVIIGYGTNESQFERLPMDQYEQDTKEAIRRIRAALPDVSIMLAAPMDRGTRGAGGAIITRPMILKLASYQRRIAAETGCAFFDTFTAMGGEGTVARWYEARPKLIGGDFTHPTAQGAEIVGTLIYDAMINAYEEYKQKETGIRGRGPNKRE
ncbi:MAG TPA: GDSL-type esterase/lipase family protein [Blastocatellia bacterium]|nr:GDSL-type esterase/lipase family protein [Blastocatellia bacterium]